MEIFIIASAVGLTKNSGGGREAWVDGLKADGFWFKILYLATNKISCLLSYTL